MYRIVPVFLLVAGCVAGCASQRNGVVVAYQPGDEPEVVRTPHEATYNLVPLPTARETGPRARVALAGGLPIGFEKAPDGRLFALANQKHIPLPDGAYSWQAEPGDNLSPAGQMLGQIRDRAGATTDEAGQVLGLPIRAALFACLFPLFYFGPRGGP
jgi:hypothetical protein